MFKIKYINAILWLRLVVFIFAFTGVHAQGNQQDTARSKKELLQVSGVIVASDSKLPLPFATIRIRGTYRGTIASADGFYSLAAVEKDTLEYSAIGYKKKIFIVPQKAGNEMITHNQSLQTDTITFEETVVYPWPTKEEFKEAFLALQLEDDYNELAKQNMDRQKLQDLYETLAKDGKEHQLLALQQVANSYYYAGGQTNYTLIGNSGIPIPASLLNPFAWTQFIKALQEGKYKNKVK